MPSVRTLAGQYLLNPLTVNRACRRWATKAWWRPAADWASTCAPARANAAGRRTPALPGTTNGPRLRERLKRLGLGAHDLNWEEH
jgi:GntR family transcriptional regulator